ncbi:unannotated protein [freshwater metagenome]|uniref:Unannotated protein n=1 Tax=freshwater metagenome TaxID=449393 RepID=A0A6J7JKZ2_9ZZZZ
MHFYERDRENFALGVGDNPATFFFGNAIGSIHPIQRFVRAAVGMDGHASIGLHHDEASRQRKMSRQATGVINGTGGDDKTHEVVIVGAAS